MTKKLMALALVPALALCVCSTSVFADGSKASEPSTVPEVKETLPKGANKANPKLKTDMERLLTDAKAGKVAPRPQQFPQTGRNNLSKTTKIAILVAAIGSAIFVGILLHDLSKD